MRIKKYKKNTPLLVIWVDIHQNPVWMSDEEASKSDPVICASVGLFTDVDDGNLIMSQTATQGQRDKIEIPLGTIKSVEELIPLQRSGCVSTQLEHKGV